MIALPLSTASSPRSSSSLKLHSSPHELWAPAVLPAEQSADVPGSRSPIEAAPASLNVVDVGAVNGKSDLGSAKSKRNSRQQSREKTSKQSRRSSTATKGQKTPAVKEEEAKLDGLEPLDLEYI